MPKITFLFKDGTTKDVDATIGHSLMEVAVANGIDPIEGACGGSLSCATCHAYIHPVFWEKSLPAEGALDEEEEDMLDLAFDVRENSRLTCQITITEDHDGMVVALPGAKTTW